MKFVLNSFNKEGKARIAGIVADLMGDGHLQNPPKNRFDYTSKHVGELDRFGKEIYKLFKVKGKIRRCTTNKYLTYNYGVNNKELAIFLDSVGVPRGNKVLKKFEVPRWIISDKIYFVKFINRLFSCEASVDVKNKAIDFQMYKSIELLKDGFYFFNQIKENLEKYCKIRTTNVFLSGRHNIRKDGIATQCIRFKIKNLASLKKYNQFIGFEDKIKQEKLDNILN